MSSQDPFGSTTAPERPTNTTHFGGEGLYELELKSEASQNADSATDSSLKVPLVEQVDNSLLDDRSDRGSLLDAAPVAPALDGTPVSRTLFGGCCHVS